MSAHTPTPNLDDVVDALATLAELETGAHKAEVARRARTEAGRRAALAHAGSRANRHLEWTAEEDDFLRANLGRMSEQEIARHLGRSQIAVHLHWKRDLRLPPPSKDPRILTAEQIATGLRMDSKSVHKLIDRGLLPGRRLPTQGCTIRVVDRVALLEWLVNPRNWVYFDPKRVGSRAARGVRRVSKVYDAAFWDKARRLVLACLARWDDEWWTPGQVAAYHGLVAGPHGSAAVNNHILDGRLPAVRWGNWRILRSDAVAHFFAVGKGKGRKRGSRFTDRADAFAILARGCGVPWSAISKLMCIPSGAIEHRLKTTLGRKSAIASIARRHGLEIECSRSGNSLQLFADWKRYRRRLPGVDRAMRHLRSRKQMDRVDCLYACGVLRAWAERYYRARDRAAVLDSLQYPHTRRAPAIRAMLDRLKAAGVDPYTSARSLQDGKARK